MLLQRTPLCYLVSISQKNITCRFSKIFTCGAGGAGLKVEQFDVDVLWSGFVNFGED
jgi:hypothetical protein